MGKTVFVTITGMDHYYGITPYKIGRVIRLRKDPANDHDSEAIRAELPFIGTIGYVANSTFTVARGTSSAGRIYDCFDTDVFAQILFIVGKSVICVLGLDDENDPPECSNSRFFARRFKDGVTQSGNGSFEDLAKDADDCEVLHIQPPRDFRV